MEFENGLMVYKNNHAKFLHDQPTYVYLCFEIL